MKPVIIASLFVATNAMALDFDKEWAKFEPDFARLKTYQVAKVERKSPLVKTVPTDTVLADDEVLPAKNTELNTLERVDPKSPDRLGHTLSDPELRKHVQSLYKKPDTVVYSLTLTE